MGQTQKVQGVATTITSDSDGMIHVTYHQTKVVSFNVDHGECCGKKPLIILNSGGYRTATTKARMNQASNQFNLGYVVFQKNFDWFVRLPKFGPLTQKVTGDNELMDLPFIDGMEFSR